MSTFSITTSRKLPILFVIELILRYENNMFFWLVKRSALRLLFVMSKLLERSVLVLSVSMCVLENHKLFKQSSRFLVNSYCLPYLNVASSFSNFSHWYYHYPHKRSHYLTIPFQLVINLFNLILKIFIHPLYNTRKTNTHFITDFHFLNGFRYFTDLPASWYLCHESNR